MTDQNNSIHLMDETEIIEKIVDVKMPTKLGDFQLHGLF